MSEQANLQQVADNGYYDPYYDNYSYNFVDDYIIWVSLAGALIIGVGTFSYFMIKRRNNRARRAQLTAAFLATNQFQPGSTANQAAGQGLPPPTYAHYSPQGQQVYAIPAQPGFMTGGGYQYQPTYQPGTTQQTPN